MGKVINIDELIKLIHSCQPDKSEYLNRDKGYKIYLDGKSDVCDELLDKIQRIV